MSEAQEQKPTRGRGRGGNNQNRDKKDKPEGERPQTAQQRPAGRGRGAKAPPKEDNEETKQDRPQTAKDGNRGRGQRGGRGGNRGGNREGGEAREPREDRPKRERVEDVNSWIYKFHHDDSHKKYDMSIEVTADTEVPELPAKEDIIKNQPDKKDLDKELDALEAEAKVIQKKKDALIKKKQETRDGGTIGKSNTTYGGQLKNLIQEQKELTKEKRAIQDKMNGFQKEMDELDIKRKKLTQNMMQGFHSFDDITEEIAAKKHRMTTCTISGAEEREIVKDIQKLTNSLPQAKEMTDITPRIKELKGQKNALFGDLKAKRALVEIKSAEIDKFKNIMDTKREEQNSERNVLDKMGDEIGVCNEEVQAVFKKKEVAREAYWEARYKHREQQDLINYVKFITDRKRQMVENDKEYQTRRAEIENSVQNVSNPMKEEIRTCDFLIGLCDAELKRAGLREESAMVAAKLQKQQQQEAIEKKREEMIKANKLEVGLTKQQREEQDQGMQRKGKKKNKGRQNQQTAEEVPQEVSQQLDLGIVQKYSFVGVSPPLYPAEMEEKIKEIEKKRAAFIEKGDQDQENAVENHKKHIAERLAELDAEMEQEKAYQAEQATRSRGRGQRGGRGGHQHNDRDNNRGGRGGRGGRGRGGRGGFQPREREERNVSDEEADAENQEFTGGADKEEVSQPFKAAPKKQKDLKMDEDNFPTL